MCKKVLATIFITTSLIATPLLASNFFQQISIMPTNKVTTIFKAKPHSESKKGVNNFVDFSGTWVGNCTGHEGTETITIENSESQFTVDGEKFEIGSLNTQSTSNRDSTYFFHMLLEWSTDHSSLLYNGSYAALAHMDELNGKIFGYQKGSISLKNEQLVFEISSQNSDSYIDNETIVCTYQKQ